ncbi:MAG TPA: KH domain-containing protein [Solirubrobacteraceae bacterium]|nr:KH domain-containing protein [Solirubrobacteraceae bacterium]
MAVGSRELLEVLARSLVEDPAAVQISSFEEDDGTVVYELAVGEDDYGLIIGRGGRTANAMRTVVKAAATRERRRVLVDIVD